MITVQVNGKKRWRPLMSTRNGSGKKKRKLVERKKQNYLDLPRRIVSYLVLVAKEQMPSSIVLIRWLKSFVVSIAILQRWLLFGVGRQAIKLIRIFLLLRTMLNGKGVERNLVIKLNLSVKLNQMHQIRKMKSSKRNLAWVMMSLNLIRNSLTMILQSIWKNLVISQIMKNLRKTSNCEWENIMKRRELRKKRRKR